MRQMMSLGGFVFSLSEGKPYEGLPRTSDGGWVAVVRYGQIMCVGKDPSVDLVIIAVG